MMRRLLWIVTLVLVGLVGCSAENAPSQPLGPIPIETPTDAQYRQAHDRCYTSMKNVLRRSDSVLPTFGDLSAETDNRTITLTYATISPQIVCTIDTVEDKLLNFCWAGTCTNG